MALQLRQNLSVRMEQRLKLTPQMIQSIEILLLPQMALEERIMHEVESNPVLEITEGPDMDGPDGAPVEAAEPVVGETAWDRADREDADWLFQHKAKHRDDDAPDKMEALESAPNRAQPLAEFLLDQLRFQDVPPEVRELIPDICWQLDRRGFLPVPLSELFPEAKLELAEQAWEWVRKCEPAGIGARDLKDCLLLQLGREPGDNSFEMMLIREHLEDVLKNRLPAVAAATGADIERVKQGVEVIAQLDPKPGLPFAIGANAYVVPDVVVERDEQGEWVVSIPDQHLPKVRISDSYYQLYEGNQGDQKEKAYLKEKLASAKFILDAVAQRKRTLLKIVTEII